MFYKYGDVYKKFVGAPGTGIVNAFIKEHISDGDLSKRNVWQYSIYNRNIGTTSQVAFSVLDLFIFYVRALGADRRQLQSDEFTNNPVEKDIQKKFEAYAMSNMHNPSRVGVGLLNYDELVSRAGNFGQFDG
jgi:hypothetical protein